MSSNQYVREISFFILSICTEKLKLALNAITFLPNQPSSDSRELTRISNVEPCTEEEYSSGSAFLVNLATPDKEFQHDT